MHITAEISLYPFREDYGPAIDDFIKTLEASENLLVEPGTMSTFVSGEYQSLMQALEKAMLGIFEKEHALFNLKLSNSCAVK